MTLNLSHEERGKKKKGYGVEREKVEAVVETSDWVC